MPARAIEIHLPHGIHAAGGSIPVGACWLNLQEGWWRVFREAALADRSFANRDDIEYATTLATNQLKGLPTPGSGADLHHQLACYGADMCTAFEEPSTRVCFRSGSSSVVGREGRLVCPASGQGQPA